MTSALSNDVTNQLWNGDCLKLLPKIAGNSANFILTDPPYITSYRSRDGRSVPNDNNDAWLKPAFAEMGERARTGAGGSTERVLSLACDATDSH